MKRCKDCEWDTYNEFCGSPQPDFAMFHEKKKSAMRNAGGNCELYLRKWYKRWMWWLN